MKRNYGGPVQCVQTCTNLLMLLRYCDPDAAVCSAAGIFKKCCSEVLKAVNLLKLFSFHVDFFVLSLRLAMTFLLIALVYNGFPVFVNMYFHSTFLPLKFTALFLNADSWLIFLFCLKATKI